MTFSNSVLSTAADHLVVAAKSFDEDVLPALDELEIDGKRGFERNRPIIKSELPISLIGLRLRTIEGLLRALPNDLPLGSIPVALLINIRDNAARARGLVATLMQSISATKSDGGIAPTTWTELNLASLNGGRSEPLIGQHLEPLLDTTDGLLVDYNQLLPVATPESIEFRVFIERAAAASREARDASNGARGAADVSNKAATQAAAYQQSAEDAAAAAEANAASIKQIKEGIAAIDAETRAKKAEADTTLAAAAALKKRVEEYTADLTAFQNTLTERNNEWAKGKKELEDLIAALKKENETIEDTIVKAETMLATATNAGLTAAQEDRFEKLNTELTWAGYGVYVAYGFLFVSIIPLVAYIVGNWNTTIPFRGGLEYAANIGLRIFLLAPALLLVHFTNFRYGRLFRLKHEYGFRASLAGAVEGFKTQAPDHGQDIAAVAFYQLGRNPAEAIDGHSTLPEWYQKLHDIVERFGDRFGRDKVASPQD